MPWSDWPDVEDVAAGLAPEFFQPPPRQSPFAPSTPVRFRLAASAEMIGRMTRRKRLNAELDAAFGSEPGLRPFDERASLRRVDGDAQATGTPPASPLRDGGPTGEAVKVTTPSITFVKTGGKETITVQGVGEDLPPTYAEEDGEADEKCGVTLHAITTLEEVTVLGGDCIRWTFDGKITYRNGRINFVKLISGEHKGLVDVRQISDLSDYRYDDPEEHRSRSSEFRLANVITQARAPASFGWFRLEDFVSLQGQFTIVETSGADLKDIIEDVFTGLQAAADLSAPLVQAISSGGAAVVLGAVKENQSLVALGKIISGLIEESKTLFADDVRIDRAAIERAFRLAAVQLPQDTERGSKRIFRASDVPDDTVFGPGTDLATVNAAVKVVDAGIYNAVGIGDPVEYRVTWLKRQEGGLSLFEKRHDYLVAIRYERVRRTRPE